MTELIIESRLAEIDGRLRAIRARVDAATEGPWEAFGTTVGAFTGPGDCGGCSGLLSPEHEPSCYWSEIAGASEPDAEFIAASRTDLPALLAAVEAVMELHAADEDGDCAECIRRAQGRGDQSYPCPTIRALTAALETQDTTREDQTHD